MNKVLNFLKYGYWEEITIGMTLQQVHNFKSMKKHFYHSYDSDSYAIFYDNDSLEIALFKDTIMNISLRDPYNKKLYGLRSLTLSSFIRFLNKYEIKWEFEQKNCFNQQLGIITEGKVMIMFNFSEQSDSISSVSKGI